MKKILYIRSGPYQVDIKSYNLQELGLARAFFDLGYTCDVVYYHKKRNFDQVIEKNGVKIKILWRHGIRLLRSGIYPQILKKSFLEQYDCVICSEYSQIMSYLLSKKFNKFYIYNGPYYNLFKIPFMEKIYDFLFCKKLNQKVKCVFCKTFLSEKYLNGKEINKTMTVGVGLDIEKFQKDLTINKETEKILKAMKFKKNILYIGSITDRKNTQIIIKSFINLCEKYNDIQLILIGKGDKKYIKFCKNLIPNNLKSKVLWFDHVDNSQTQFIYKNANVFVLPSKKEIFGMVLLEAMYFGLPVISSNSAGALTLINDTNGIILDNFEIERWSKAMDYILSNEEEAKKIGNNAHNTIINEFMWSSIAKKMIDVIQK